MSLFDSIKSAIFGSSEAQPASTETQSSVPAPDAIATAQQAVASGPPVDVSATLAAMAAKKGDDLNYQSSIVDLMKLLDLDSSRSRRTALASELGYTGDTEDSAAMNMWLHAAVMSKLAEDGGVVPEEWKS